MRDEEYLYYQDVREKKVTGYSARKQRSHCGKSGRVRFPSDNLTKKELMKMNGECKSYRLNEPMTWDEFRAMPDDIKVTYIMALRAKYNAPVAAIAKMMGTDRANLSRYLLRLGFDKMPHGNHKWDKMGFSEWCYGLPKTEESVQEEVKEEILVEETPAEVEQEVEQEVVEDEAPVVEEVVPFVEVPKPVKINLIKEEDTSSINFAVPASGTLTFRGTACEIMNTINRLLGNAKIAMEVQWTALED